MKNFDEWARSLLGLGSGVAPTHGLENSTPRFENPQEELEDVQRAIMNLKNLTDHPGWQNIQEEGLARVREILDLFSEGGHTQSEYDRLSGELNGIRYLLDLPRRKQRSYNDLLSDLRHLVEEGPDEKESYGLPVG